MGIQTSEGAVGPPISRRRYQQGSLSKEGNRRFGRWRGVAPAQRENQAAQTKVLSRHHLSHPASEVVRLASHIIKCLKCGEAFDVVAGKKAVSTS
jgi:hypothetical protein